jgi:catechol 2,3-dioxygenase-like lactoylglutathione lyase family enzyme
MKLEHVAVNVSDPVAMADWYREHLGLDVVRAVEGPPFTHFLRDSGGRMMLEIYCNPPDQVPDYGAMDPLLLHFAFVSDDPDADKARLLDAGATVLKEETLDDGSYLVTMRDPWGLCIQFCNRAEGMLQTP